MIYAALGIAITLLFSHGAAFGAGHLVGAAQLEAERLRRQDAEARAAAAESRGVAAQPRHIVDALATPDDRLLDAVWSTDPSDRATELVAPSGSDEVVIRLEDSDDAA